MELAAPLLNGLELAGPYMFLLMGGVGTLIGWGLLRLNKWARRAALVVALIGVVMLIPAVSAAAIDLGTSLIWGGLGIIVRVIIVWYLYQAPVAEAFEKN
jgi:multidrug transporter EmrE-like cation transporter